MVLFIIFFAALFLSIIAITTMLIIAKVKKDTELTCSALKLLTLPILFITLSILAYINITI